MHQKTISVQGRKIIVDEKTILVVGPQGAGKRFIANNLTGRKSFSDVEKQKKGLTPSTKVILKNDDSGIMLNVWNFSGLESNEKQSDIIPPYLNIPTLSAVIIAIDCAQLMQGQVNNPDGTTSPAGIDVLSSFLNKVKESLPPGFPIRIVVNKIDRVLVKGVDDKLVERPASEADRQQIKNTCNNLIRQLQLPHTTQLVYYSAKEEIAEVKEEDAAVVQPNPPQNLDKKFKSKPLNEDLLFQSLEVVLFGQSTASTPNATPASSPKKNLDLHQNNQSREMAHLSTYVLSYFRTKRIANEFFGVLGKILLFLFLFAVATAAFMTLGALIGAAVGVWSGPGAFFTAMGGAFLGALTAWNLAVWIAAPVLGVLVPTTIFAIWHRKSPDVPEGVVKENAQAPNHKNNASPDADLPPPAVNPNAKVQGKGNLNEDGDPEDNPQDDNEEGEKLQIVGGKKPKVEETKTDPALADQHPSVLTQNTKPLPEVEKGKDKETVDDKKSEESDSDSDTSGSTNSSDDETSGVSTVSEDDDDSEESSSDSAPKLNS